MANVRIAGKTLIILLISAATSRASLKDLIPGLYGGDGITLASNIVMGVEHNPHFTRENGADLSDVGRLNREITADLGVFPFSSSAGGFTFAFDKDLGTFVETTETLGPLFAERAPTLGQGKLNLNLAATFFRYDELNGRSLQNLHATLRHDADAIPPDDVRTDYELDTIDIKYRTDIRVGILSLAATYGITDRLDVGVLVPLVHIDMDVRSHATIVISPQNTHPNAHTFNGPGAESPDDSASGDATGIGDIVARAKYQLVKNNAIDLAAEVLAQLPTGNQDDFLGGGNTIVRPFLVLSRSFSDVVIPQLNLTPHVNVGYDFDVERSTRNSLEYVAGFDLGTKQFTLTGEFIGSHDLHSRDILTGSVGAKWRMFKKVVISGNVQFPLNNEGLRSDLIPTVGVECSF